METTNATIQVWLQLYSTQVSELYRNTIKLNQAIQKRHYLWARQFKTNNIVS